MHPTKRLTRILAVLLLAAVTGCVAPAGTSGRVTVSQPGAQLDIAFSDHDRSLLRQHYVASLPPGLAKKGKIPPGHQKRLARHQVLPPGAAWERLPADLERRLSPLPQGYLHIRVGTDVAIFDVKTRLLLDVVNDL